MSNIKKYIQKFFHWLLIKLPRRVRRFKCQDAIYRVLKLGKRMKSLNRRDALQCVSTGMKNILNPRRIKMRLYWLAKTKNGRMVSAIILIIFIVLPVYYIFFHQSAAAWWNENWYYRKSIQLTNTGGDQTNVYVNVTVDTSDTTKFQDDCGDLRFTKPNGDELQYYIDSGCGTSSTSVLVSFDTYPSGDNQIYEYYGNPTAPDGFKSPRSRAGSVPQASMKMSILAGTAFVDFGTANILTDFVGQKLTVTDSAGKKLIGYIKAAGSGETLGNNVLTNGDFSDATYTDSSSHTLVGWTNSGTHNASNKVTISSGQATLISDGTFVGIQQASVLTNGELFQYSWNIVSVTSGFVKLVDSSSGTAYSQGNSTGIKSGYATAFGISVNVNRNGGTTNTTFDNVSIKQVLTPSVTGVTITSTQNGSTYSWASEESGFNRNDSSGYTYTITPEPNSVAQANMRLSIVAGTAFTDFSSANTLTQYSGNRLKITDSASKTLTGFIKSAGTGETYGSNIFSTYDFTSGWTPTAGVTTPSSTQITTSSGAGGVYKNAIATPGALYKSSATASTTDGSARFYAANMAPIYNNDILTTTTYATTVSDTGFYIRSGGNGTLTITAINFQQVLTPSATGVTITSTQNGSTYSWKTEDSGFNRNDSSNYTYIIYATNFSTEASNYTVGTIGSEEKSPAPIAYWSFDEGYGTVAHDETSNRNNGTITGATWKPESECLGGKCLYFDGSSNTVVIPGSASLNMSDTVSVSVWFKGNQFSDDYEGIVGKGAYSSNKGFLFQVNALTPNGYVRVDTETTNQAPGGASHLSNIIDNRWHNVTFILDNGVFRSYLDGNKKADTTYVATGGFGSNANMFIGFTGLSNYFKGYIDEVKMYPYARSADQIKQDYNSGISNMGKAKQGASATFGGYNEKWLTDGLVGYWKMDESTGTAVQDSSGNGNTGTMTNMLEAGTAAVASATNTIVPSNTAPFSTADNAYNNMIVTVTGGVGCGVTANTQSIAVGYTAASNTIYVSPAFAAETDNCNFTINHLIGGKFGNSAAFQNSVVESTNSYITAGTSPVLNITGNQITLSAWVKIPSTPSHVEGILSKSGYDNGYRMYVNTDRTITFQLTNPNNLKTSTAISTGVWHHIAGVYDGNRMRVFIDGIKDSVEYVRTGNIDSASQELNIGLGDTKTAVGQSWSYPFFGSIDETRIYNRALTPAEVAKLYEWAPGPVAYYNFDEGVGSSAADLSSNSNLASFGTGLSAPTWTNGKYGEALSFANANLQYTSVADSSSTRLTSIGTIEAWVNPTSYPAAGNWYAVVNKGNFGTSLNDYTIYYSGTDSKLKVAVGGGSTYAMASINNTYTPLKTWSHIVAFWDGSYIYIYINGVYITKAAMNGVPDTTGSNLFIGRNRGDGSTTYTFDGKIDDVRIYNYPRTQKQILADMQNLSLGQIAPPLAYYNFDEGVGRTAYNSGLGCGDAQSCVSTRGTLGTGNSSPSWTNDGKFGKALSFNGAGQNATVPDVDGVTDFDYNQDFSVSTWVKIPSTQNNTASTTNSIIEKWSSSGGYPYVLRVYNQTYGTTGDRGKIKFARYDGTNNPALSSTVALNDNNWHHLTFAKTGSLLSLYIDGVLNDSRTDSTTTTTTNSSVLYFGSQGGAFYFTGQIDEPKVYNYGLTSDDVREDMNRGMAEQMGSLGVGNTATSGGAASQEYCVPGDSTSCAAPVGEWKMDEKTGGTAYDTSGNGYNGTLGTGPSAPTWGSGKYGGGLSFDGSYDYVDTGQAITTAYITNKTIETWFKAVGISGSAGNGNDVIIGGARIGGSNDQSGFYIDLDPSNVLSVGIADSTKNYITLSATINLNSWYHVALVQDFDNNKMYLYLNGIKSGEATVNGYTKNPSGWPLVFGRYSGYGQLNRVSFNGSLDQVRVYDYARTASQIAWEYNQGAPVAEWDFNEGQGSVAHDESLNRNDGTINIGVGGTQTTLGTITTPTDGTGAWYNGWSNRRNSSNNQSNGAMSFDGVDDYIDAGTGPSLGVGATADVTISAWIRPDSLSGLRTIVSKGKSLTSYGYVLRLSNENVQTVNSLGAVNLGITATQGVWQHITAVYKSDGTVTGYLNGRSYPSVSMTTYADTQKLFIGSAQSSTGGALNPFSGQIDDVKIFNYALTATQVQTQYNGGAVSFGN